MQKGNLYHGRCIEPYKEWELFSGESAAGERVIPIPKSSATPTGSGASGNSQHSNTPKNDITSSLLVYVGHIFLLGLAALVVELVNLQAGVVLDALLEPFQNGNTESIEDALLADEFGESLVEGDLFPVIGGTEFGNSGG